MLETFSGKIIIALLYLSSIPVIGILKLLGYTNLFGAYM
jgi:hypothetical protein